MAEGGPQNTSDSIDYSAIRRSPGKNDPEFYPPGYVPSQRPYLRHPLGYRGGYEQWQQIPQTWDEPDYSKCPIDHPKCRKLYNTWLPSFSLECKAKMKEIWDDIKQAATPAPPEGAPGYRRYASPPPPPPPQRPQDALNRSRPQDVAVRELCRQMTDWHRSKYPGFPTSGNIIRPGTESGWNERHGYDTSRWTKLDFDKCWVKDPDCISNPEFRRECKARTKNIYEKILANPGPVLRKHPNWRHFEPEAQAIYAVTKEILDWHNSLTPEFMEEGYVPNYEPICDYQP